MNRCLRNQENIACLAAGVLEESLARPLQVHLIECPGCRQYLHELSQVCREHREAASESPDTEVSAAFHRRLRARVEAQSSVGATGSVETIRGWVASWRWEPAMAVASLVVVVLALLLARTPSPDPAVIRDGPGGFPRIEEGPRTRDSSLIAYRRAADRSNEELEWLLARDAIRLLPASREKPLAMRSRFDLAESLLP